MSKSLLVITKYDNIEIFHELKKFNSKVQFTYESATNNTLLVLDCLIKMDNEGRLKVKVYRKKTHACIIHQINQNM